MSKKTKLEKIVARERRKYQIATQLDSSASSSQYSFKAVDTKNKTSSNQTVVVQNHHEAKLVVKDLAQTLILTVLAIGAQLCVYYLVELKHFQFKF